MFKKKKNRLKTVLITIVLLLGGGFLLNWYLTYKLEEYLRKELISRVADASHGLYKLSFEKLDVGLLNGELLLEGVKLVPDSVLLKKWEFSDSLPATCLNVDVKSIGFKGVNLTWRRNYKQLHFALFEIKTPRVDVYELHSSNSDKKNEKKDRPLKLYDLISPYIDELTVKKMNLDNASVSYHTKDSITPSVYALNDVSFHAYNFILDQNSFAAGKLLYCDNFDFTTNIAQQLFSSKQMLLTTDKITLSTQDSLIHIRGISIKPPKGLWTNMNFVPGNYLDAEVDLVEIRGVAFKRHNAQNSLTARTFDIVSTEINSFAKKDNLTQKTDKDDSIMPENVIN